MQQIHDEQHSHINGILIHHVQQQYDEQQVAHIRHQRNQNLQPSHIIIECEMRNDYKVIVHQLQRLGTIYHRMYRQ